MHTDLLRECEAEIAALKQRIALLEERLAAFAAPAPEEEVDFTGVEIGVDDLPEAPVQEVPVAEVPAKEVPVAEVPAKEVPVAEASVTESPASAEIKVDAPAGDSVTEAPAPAIPRETYPWQLAAPGASVKNIRSGISLQDRAVFIGTLFREDYALYDATIAALNGMSNLQEAEDYIVAQFPEWNLGSDPVFHFMMAVRKKLG